MFVEYFLDLQFSVFLVTGTSVLPPHMDLMNVQKEETEVANGRSGFTRESSPASSSSMSHQNEDSMDVSDFSAVITCILSHFLSFIVVMSYTCIIISMFVSKRTMLVTHVFFHVKDTCCKSLR